jgi:hypothetical protein
MRWDRHAARMEEKKVRTQILWGIQRITALLEDLDINDGVILKWKLKKQCAK